MDRDEKKNLANIQPTWPHTWSITHIYIYILHCKVNAIARKCKKINSDIEALKQSRRFSPDYLYLFSSATLRLLQCCPGKLQQTLCSKLQKLQNRACLVSHCFKVDEHLAIQLIHRHATLIWKQILQIEHNMLKIPTGWRQTSWLKSTTYHVHGWVDPSGVWCSISAKNQTCDSTSNFTVINIGL